MSNFLDVFALFTLEDLVQYYYNETSLQKTAEIKDALEKDWSLREKLGVIASAQKRLEVLKLSPRKKTIENIENDEINKEKDTYLNFNSNAKKIIKKKIKI